MCRRPCFFVSPAFQGWGKKVVEWLLVFWGFDPSERALALDRIHLERAEALKNALAGAIIPAS